MNALTLLKHLCDPDSSKTFLKEPGLGCQIRGLGIPCVTATNGRVLLAVHSERFDPSQGLPRTFDEGEVRKLHYMMEFFKPDAPALLADVGDLVLWADAPHFSDCEFCDWPDRCGILCGAPVDRVQVARLLHVAYWLVQPLEYVHIRRCAATPEGGQPGDVLFFNGAGRKGAFLGAIMSLKPADGTDTTDWPVFPRK